MKNLFVLFVAILFFSSCSKEYRFKEFKLRTFNNAGVAGSVFFKETKDENVTLVRLEAKGLRTDTLYHTHLHTGVPGALTGTLIYFLNMRTATGEIIREEKWAQNYDDALKSNICFTMHEPDFFSNDSIGYVLAGETGGNAK
jgi:hypothetical protein